MSGTVILDKKKIEKFINLINNTDCNCEEVRFPLCGGCQIKFGLNELMRKKDEVKE